MVVVLVDVLRANAGPLKSLLVGEAGEDAKDDGDPGIESDPHEGVGDRVGDVLEVHGGALDEDADRDEDVVRLRGAGGGCGAGEGGEGDGGRRGEEVGRGRKERV